MVESHLDDEWLRTFQFWKKIPTTTEVDSDTFYKLAGQEIRNAILEILRTGIKDEIVEDKNSVKRYALSAAEMLPLLNKKLTEPVKITKIYFHLDKLEEANLIKKIITRLEGKNYVSYYGRTSKIIILRDQDELENKEKTFQRDLSNLLKTINPKINTKKITKLTKKIFARHRELFEQETNWLEKNHDIIANLGIDFRELLMFFKFTTRGHDSILFSSHSELYKELDLDLYNK